MIDDAAAAESLGAALKAGGLPLAEVTFRTPAAEEALRLLVGRPRALRGSRHCAATRAGRPGGGRRCQVRGLARAETSVVQRCASSGVPVFPGVATPSEIMAALDLGLSTVKLFPAESLGGVSTVKALCRRRSVQSGSSRRAASRGPSWCPTWRCPAVLAIGGSWMVSSSLIAAGAFDEITRLTAEAVAVAAAVPA